MLQSPNCREQAYALKYQFTDRNNESKYEALIEELRMALALNVEQLIIYGDSKVLFGHVTRPFEPKEDNMKKHSIIVKSIIKFAATWFEKSTKRITEKRMSCQK